MRRDAQANRERILDAAEAVFGAHAATGSTEEVARRAGVGVATVFRHFPTKEALIEAALARHFARVHEQAVELAEVADPADAFRRLVAIMIDTGATKLTLASGVRGGGEIPPAVREAAGELRETMRGILERAQAAGAVHEDVTVDVVYMLIRAIAQARVTMPPEPGTLGGAVEVVLRGLAPPG